MGGLGISDTRYRRQITNSHTNGSMAQNANIDADRANERRRLRGQERQGRKQQFNRQRWKDESRVVPGPAHAAIYAEGTNPLNAVHPTSDDDGSVGSHQQRQRRQQEKQSSHQVTPQPSYRVPRNGGAYAEDPRPKGFAGSRVADRQHDGLPHIPQALPVDDILEESFDDIENMELLGRAERDSDPSHRRVHNMPKQKVVGGTIVSSGGGSIAERSAGRAAERAAERAERMGTLRGKLSNRQSMNVAQVGINDGSPIRVPPQPSSITEENGDEQNFNVTILGSTLTGGNELKSTVLADTLNFPTVRLSGEGDDTPTK